jgi:hypothetical protein
MDRFGMIAALAITLVSAPAWFYGLYYSASHQNWFMFYGGLRGSTRWRYSRMGGHHWVLVVRARRPYSGRWCVLALTSLIIRSMPPQRRFPPPWTLEENNNACFILRDKNGRDSRQ